MIRLRDEDLLLLVAGFLAMCLICWLAVIR